MLAYKSPLECKKNYFKILENINSKFYFNIENIPNIGKTPINLKVDIFRNNIMMKNNIKVEIKKKQSDSDSKSSARGQIRLLESTFKLKKNDTIILKKNI